MFAEHYMFGLYLACTLSALRNPRAAILLAVCLTLARASIFYQFPFMDVWFFAIYAGIGALVFFSRVDDFAGGLLLLISIPGGLYAFGLTSVEFRDTYGEIVFLLSALLAACVGPSGTRSNRSDFDLKRFGNIPILRRSGVDRQATTGAQEKREVRAQ